MCVREFVCVCVSLCVKVLYFIMQEKKQQKEVYMFVLVCFFWCLSSSCFVQNIEK